MKLYCKLAMLALVACLVQVFAASGVAGETYFALRCLVADVANDERLERQLIGECERQYEAERERAVAAYAYRSLASR